MYSYAEVFHLVNDEAVDLEQTVGSEFGNRFIDDHRYVRLHFHQPVAGHDLPAVLPAVGCLNRMFEAVARDQMSPTADGGIFQELQQRLDAEGSGADRVLVEMGLEEPLLRIDAFGG